MYPCFVYIWIVFKFIKSFHLLDSSGRKVAFGNLTQQPFLLRSIIQQRLILRMMLVFLPALNTLSVLFTTSATWYSYGAYWQFSWIQNSSELMDILRYLISPTFFNGLKPHYSMPKLRDNVSWTHDSEFDLMIYWGVSRQWSLGYLMWSAHAYRFFLLGLKYT